VFRAKSGSASISKNLPVSSMHSRAVFQGLNDLNRLMN
jgi:hypothetical protein